MDPAADAPAGAADVILDGNASDDDSEERPGDDSSDVELGSTSQQVGSLRSPAFPHQMQLAADSADTVVHSAPSAEAPTHTAAAAAAAESPAACVC